MLRGERHGLIGEASVTLFVVCAKDVPSDVINCLVQAFAFGVEAVE